MADLPVLQNYRAILYAFLQMHARHLAEELALIVRSTSPDFVSNRGTIAQYHIANFGDYSVFRGVIYSGGCNTSVYRDNLQHWLNEGKVNHTTIGREGRMLRYYDHSGSYQFLLAEGSCGFAIRSIDDPYCSWSADVSTSAITSTPTTMTSNATKVTNATNTPSEVDTDETAPSSSKPASSSNNSIPIIALAMSCIGTAISLLAVVGLALYVIILKRKYEEERERNLSQGRDNIAC